MSNRKVVAAGVSLVVVASLMSGPAYASEKIVTREESQKSVTSFSKKVASFPAVVSVVASKAKSKRVNIAVTLRLGTAIQGAGPTGSEVRIGRNICRLTRAKTKCTIKNVAVNSQLKISARTKNKFGFSKWSKAVSFRATSGNRWSPRPTVSTKRSLSRLLKTQSIKFSKFQALSAPVVTSNSVGRYSSTNDITFRVSSIIGLAQTDTSSNSGSGLLAVSTTGESFDALATGTASIRQFHVGPDGKFYVVFDSPTPLVSNGPNCVLAEVNQQTGIPTCIDSSIQQIYWNFDRPIQFDQVGRIYVVGEASNRTVLRRYHNGQATDIVNDNVMVYNFEVLPDGTIVLTGMTNSNNSQWVRRISTSNSLLNLVTGQAASFLRTFPDGNVYMGIYDFSAIGGWGVKRYMHSSGQMDGKHWIADVGSQTNKAHFNALDICGANHNSRGGFCFSSGAMVTSFHMTSGGVVYAASGGSQGQVLMQYFPTVKHIPTVVTSVAKFTIAGSKIVIAGTNQAGVNLLTIFDPIANTETIVLDRVNQVEVYSLAYSASENRLLYSGLQFSNNTVVTGEIVLP